jgi:hypothetical protein
LLKLGIAVLSETGARNGYPMEAPMRETLNDLCRGIPRNTERASCNGGAEGFWTVREVMEFDVTSR